MPISSFYDPLPCTDFLTSLFNVKVTLFCFFCFFFNHYCFQTRYTFFLFSPPLCQWLPKYLNANFQFLCSATSPALQYVFFQCQSYSLLYFSNHFFFNPPPTGCTISANIVSNECKKASHDYTVFFAPVTFPQCGRHKDSVGSPTSTTPILVNRWIASHNNGDQIKRYTF